MRLIKTSNQKTYTYIVLLSLSVINITGCLLGPNFHTPASPYVNRYTVKPTQLTTEHAKTRDGARQHLHQVRDIPVMWWSVFHSKALEQIIAEAIQNNPDLHTATAALKISAENTLTQQATFFPKVQGATYPIRQLQSETLASNLASNKYLYNLYTTQFSVGFSPDVFGNNRRQLESLRAREETAFFQKEAVYLTLTSTVVSTVIQEALLREQQKIIKKSINIAQKQLNLTIRSHKLGQIGLNSVASQEAYLAQIEASLPPIQQQLAQQRHLLHTLCGRFPSEILKPKFTLDILHLPVTLPLRLPAQLVEQRPDIRAASAQLHDASAQIGVAVSNRLPNFNLIAYAGTNPVTLATLFASGTGDWGIAANLVGTIFDAGALLHQQRAAVAAYEVYAEQYRSVVLLAFQNVADTLSAIKLDAQTLQLAKKADIAAKKSLNINQSQYKLGASNQLDVLNAEQTYQISLLTLAQAQANRLLDSVALFQAMGGGWSCRHNDLQSFE